MGYIFVLIALLAGATKGFLGKRISDRVVTERQSAFVNTIRMVMCIGISLLTMIPEFISGAVVIDGAALLWGALTGVTLSAFVVSWMLAVKHGAYTLVSVAQMFGTVVTVMLSLVVFRDPVELKQIVAIVLLCTSVFFMLSYNKGVKGRLSLVGIIILVICGLSSGLNDFSMKLFIAFSEASTSTLNLITYIISSIVLTVFLLLDRPKKQKQGTQNGEAEDENCMDASASEDAVPKENLLMLLRSTLLPIVLMAVCLFLNSYFKALSNNYIPPMQLFPIYQAGGLILSATMSALFFKERITPRCVIGLVLSFVAILLLK